MIPHERLNCAKRVAGEHVAHGDLFAIINDSGPSL